LLPERCPGCSTPPCSRSRECEPRARHGRIRRRFEIRPPDEPAGDDPELVAVTQEHGREPGDAVGACLLEVAEGPLPGRRRVEHRGEAARVDAELHGERGEDREVGDVDAVDVEGAVDVPHPRERPLRGELALGGQHLLDELLSERDKINAILQEIIDEATSPWGIKVSIVEVKDVEIPSGMQRAMARQAEAERERRAKVIAAEGEFQASERLKDAANVMSVNPVALQLRFLQTMREMSSERSSTMILPLPIELFRPFLDGAGADKGGETTRPRSASG
jgi:hypothetical protein